MQHLFKCSFNVLFLVAILFSQTVDAKGIYSPATLKALEKFQKLDLEIEYGQTVPEMLFRCSHLQDAWLTYLHEAETCADFEKGMAEIDCTVENFHHSLNYAATVVNFFNPGNPRTLFPQTVQLDSGLAFLNTFKTGRNLSEIEKEELFDEEWQQYLLERVCEPFELNAESLDGLEPGIVYNFALLPCGTIRVALEKPGGKDYFANDKAAAGDFAYPNHTILAGTPHQALLTAGSLVVYRSADKMIIFVSNKSGHFVPSYRSLEHFKDSLLALGVNPHLIVKLPTVNLGEAVLNIYNSVQIPIALDHHDANSLFQQAKGRWEKALAKLDYTFLVDLSHGNLKKMTPANTQELVNVREEATSMRSAYHLFNLSHQAPDSFHAFVKHFGGLKDALKHKITSKIKSEASWLRNYFVSDSFGLFDKTFVAAHDEDMNAFLLELIGNTKSLLAKEVLSIDEFHDIKKAARELGTLFSFISDDTYAKGTNFFIYQAASWKFYRINKQMAVIHDEQIGKILRGETKKKDIFLEVPINIKDSLNRLLDQLGVAPVTLEIKIHHEIVAKLINEAKDWYVYHSYIYREAGTEFLPGYYNPSPHALLTKIAQGEAWQLDEENRDAINLLEEVLRHAEIAKNAVILLDSTHVAPKGLIIFVNSLRKLLRGINSDQLDEVREDATIILNFMCMPAVSLEDVHSTDQDSFDALLRAYVDNLQLLDKNIMLPIYEAEMLKEHMQAIADLMNLHLRIGQKYQSMPTIAYELLLQQCENFIDEINRAIVESEDRFTISITENLRQWGVQIRRKFS